MNEILNSYIEDLRDSLVLFNEALMFLEQGSADDETINRVFRVAHTIKGNSAAMEFMKVEKVMHTMEDILHEVREGKRDLTQDIISVLYKCHDFLEDFLEILLTDENDKNVETKQLLKELTDIKNDNAPKDEEVVEEAICKEVSSFLDQAFCNIPQELLEVIDQNIKIGMFAYNICLKFAQDVPMKSIRAFMLFQKIETHTMLIYSDPENPSEDDFRTGKFEFDGDALNIIVMGDTDINLLIDELRKDTSLADVDFSQITTEHIDQYLKNYNISKDIVTKIKDIEISVLDVQKSEINKETVKNILDQLNIISSSSENISTVLRSIALRLTNILETIALENRTFTADNANTFAILLHDMTCIAKKSSCVNDKDFIDQIEENISSLEEELMIPQEKIGELLLKRGVLNKEDIDHIISKQKGGDRPLKFGQLAVKEEKVSAVELTEVLKEKQETKKNATKSTESANQIRVPVSKVDNLMNMLGELIILNSQLEQQIESNNLADDSILNTIARSSKIIRSVQDLSVSLRLIQIKNTLFRLTRIIRDTASELHKKVNISIIGEETEIDRSAAEKIFDPLMHLVRNAVSHGVESPEERIKAGKNPEGKVEIKAYSKRGHVYIEVSDDGQGIDPDKVLAKAIKVGLADENIDYSESEIINFIMKPGFSTQVEVNNISGRGVGMNVVEAELMKIGGKVDIINDKGHGCTFVLRIPMNLALVNGTIVELSGSKYIIPTLFIKQFFILEEKEWVSMQGVKRAIKFRDSVIPVITEEKIFGVTSDNNLERNQIIILEMENKLIAFPVDKIIGRQEIVSKPLSNELTKAGVLSGASILGDGKVSLILDVEAMFKLAGQ
jgi:two-component system chemotaxis sensor kinase CheA